ncbi:porin [Burkholderia multivorans]|uniref:Putative outer membrane porin n=1 Tax=Burkholderia multivorans CGD2 TaxID=513052 RepID=B9BH49_9BURK|nr:porin [Burkholderia multivorans]EEE09020.1 putative outer membrane porin [Burkholderia multivorans CGD2]EEE14939.1 putative outer membrane porin [Burkholderia multivorans CGD2M]MBU9141683.1 porin [Burkholderia multivorans]MBU9180674.1 porin [Burkholderia multivorans]MBU9280131.1 porin [Burkholderia multivorans]
MKSIVFGAVAMAATAAANAQSSVTLYGIVDNGVQYETGLAGGHRVSAESGNWAQSRFGLKGIEDIGGGTTVNFVLESRLNTQNGSYANGSFFEGQATIGMSNDAYGSFRLGNFGASALLQYAGVLDPQQTQKYSFGTLVRGRMFPQAANGIEYKTPSIGGLTIQAQYNLTNSTRWNAGNPGSAPGQLGTSTGLGSSQGRSDGVKLEYNARQLDLQLIYDEIRDGNGKFSNVYLASRSIFAAGSYVWGPVTLYAGYQHLSAPDASEAGYFGTSTPTALPAGVSVPTAVNTGWVGAQWAVTPATYITGAVYHANANNGNGNATMYTLSGAYLLSKRTRLYTELGYLRNSSTSNLGLNGGAYGANIHDDPVNGSASSTNPNYGRGQFGVFAGIATQF